MMSRAFLFALGLLVLVPRYVPAQIGSNVPDSLSIQGLLTDTGGSPVADGDYTLHFKLYKNSNLIWQQTKMWVPVSSGRFNVILGGVLSHSLDTVAFNQPIELGITVESETEMTPRVPLVAAPYALGMRGMHAVRTPGSSQTMNLIGGARNNYIASGVLGGTIGGGGGYFSGGTTSVADSVLGSWGTVSGGVSNKAGADYTTVSGGRSNKAVFTYAFVGGGQDNVAAGFHAAIAGGQGNKASGDRPTVGGGSYNVASGADATVGGGGQNQATAQYATVPGGRQNGARATGAFAAGAYARANHEYSFVWNDGYSLETLTTTEPRQFRAKAGGGTWFYSSTDTLSGVHLAPGAGTWADLSSIDAKTDIQEVDPIEIVRLVSDLPVARWRYLQEPADVRHLGPLAEDFFEAFGLGSSNRRITTVDASGVALAAIKGLYQLVKDQREELERQRFEIDRLKRELMSQ